MRPKPLIATFMETPNLCEFYAFSLDKSGEIVNCRLVQRPCQETPDAFIAKTGRRQPLLELDGRRFLLRRPRPGFYLRTPYAFRKGIVAALHFVKASGHHITGAVPARDRKPWPAEELPAATPYRAKGVRPLRLRALYRLWSRAVAG
jgi:hypothetical protein